MLGRKKEYKCTLIHFCAVARVNNQGIITLTAHTVVGVTLRIHRRCAEITRPYIVACADRLYKARGTQLDAELVDVFLSIISRDLPYQLNNIMRSNYPDKKVI